VGDMRIFFSIFMVSVIILGSILSVGCEDLCIRLKRMN